MHVLVAADAACCANAYLSELTMQLTRMLPSAGHRVSIAASLADLDHAERVLLSAGTTTLLISEGPVARHLAGVCQAQRRPYLSLSLSVPGHGSALQDSALEDLHAGADAVLTPVPAGVELLRSKGLDRSVLAGGGTDDQVFQPRVYDRLDLPRPISLLLGAGQQSDALARFQDASLPGSRLACLPDWSGPPEHDGVLMFSGLSATEQASLISAADVCVVAERDINALAFAARSLACGVPVASLPGPYVAALLDSEQVGAADPDLARAVTRALASNRQLCRRIGSACGWRGTLRLVLALISAPRSAIAA